MNKVSFVLLFLLLYPPLVNAQTTLQIGTPIEREIDGNQVHEFNVKVDENEYVELVVEQRGIDVIVKLTSPAGKSFRQFDSPNGSEGPEHVSFVALTPGKYSITVGPLHPEYKASGRYVIKLLEVRQATDQELKARKNLDVAKARGIALLTEIDSLITQIKTPQTRIKAQMQAAQMLWDTDEKRAAKSMANAIAELKAFIAAMEPADTNYQHYSYVVQLRQEIIQILANRDPDAALDFLYSTNQFVDPTGNQQERLMLEGAFELTIVDQIAAKHPERALQLARKTLKNTYSPNLLGTVMQLHQKNKDLAAELANEIAAKLLGETLLRNQEAANLTIGLIRISYESPEPGTGEAKSRQVPLPEEKAKELLQKMLNEVSSYSTPSPYSYSQDRAVAWNILSGLQAMGPQLDAMSDGSLAMVQKKILDMNGGVNPYAESPEHALIGTNTVEAALEAIGKAPREIRENLYMQLAHREVNNGDVARAKQILNDHISNSYTRRQVLANIQQQEINVALTSGKAEEALRTVGAMRTDGERAAYLSQIIGRIGPGHKRAVAVNLLEHARSMLGPSIQAPNETYMVALMEIARAFGRYDAKRSFEIIDPLIEQLNELCAAARVLNGFGSEFFQNDELDMHGGNTVANMATQMSNVLSELAIINFDRAKASADRFRLPEMRLRAYLALAEATVKEK